MLGDLSKLNYFPIDLYVRIWDICKSFSSPKNSGKVFISSTFYVILPEMNTSGYCPWNTISCLIHWPSLFYIPKVTDGTWKDSIVISFVEIKVVNECKMHTVLLYIFNPIIIWKELSGFRQFPFMVKDHGKYT